MHFTMLQHFFHYLRGTHYTLAGSDRSHVPKPPPGVPPKHLLIKQPMTPPKAKAKPPKVKARPPKSVVAATKTEAEAAKEAEAEKGAEAATTMAEAEKGAEGAVAEEPVAEPVDLTMAQPVESMAEATKAEPEEQGESKAETVACPAITLYLLVAIVFL